MVTFDDSKTVPKVSMFFLRMKTFLVPVLVPVKSTKMSHFVHKNNERPITESSMRFDKSLTVSVLSNFGNPCHVNTPPR